MRTVHGFRCCIQSVAEVVSEEKPDFQDSFLPRKQKKRRMMRKAKTMKTRNKGQNRGLWEAVSGFRCRFTLQEIRTNSKEVIAYDAGTEL